MQDRQIAIAAKAPDSSYDLHLPAEWDWQTSWNIEREYFWDPAPMGRIALLGAGLVLILVRDRVIRRLRRKPLSLPVHSA